MIKRPHSADVFHHVPLVCFVAAWLVLLWTPRASAQTGDNILLVTNALSQASDEIGEYYARARTIPSAQILRLPVPIAEQVERYDYETKIERPIASWLTANAAQDRILYIVLAKDVPLRIAGSTGQTGTVASVDSELALLYRKMYGARVQTAGPVKNPLFLDATLPNENTRFTHRVHDVYLVGRLDGYTVADVKALIDRGLSPARQGIVVLDGKLELTASVGNKWLAAAAATLQKTPGWSDRVVLDTGQTTVTEQANVIGFYTWGSNAVIAKERHYKHMFAPGAIAAEYVSTDARTFKEPPADWVINDTAKPFGGSHQSLIGDLIRDGVTGVAGHVAEPFLNATIRPDLLFPSYVGGFNLIESFYMAMPSLSWQTVVVGDVLCAPFRTRPALTTDLNPAVDPNTELPEFFSARRLAMLTAAGAKAESAAWLAKAEVRAARNDRPGSREALEQATRLDDLNVPAQVALGQMYEQSQEWDAAMERYRRVLEKAPNQAIALNNLAYSLATRKNDPSGALPLAKRAYAVSIQDPMMGDTLAWVHHLLGNDADAEPIIAMSAQRLPGNADVLVHAAFIFAATGKTPIAVRHLDAALKLDAALATRADIKELQSRLRPPAKK